MAELLEPFQYGFIQRALAGALLVALVCGTIGVFVVLRGLAFLGDAIAHAAFPGVVLAFLLRIDLVIGGTIAAVAGALGMGALARRTGLREDTAIGVVFSGMFAFGIVLFSGITRYTGDLLGVLLGNVLGIDERQLLVIAGVTAAILAVLWMLWKELVFVSFDPTGAAAAGLRVTLYDALLLGLIGLAIAVSVQVVGIVLVVAMLVTPAATARLVARDLRSMVALSLAFAFAAAVAGIYASYYLNSASGGTIVLAATTIFGLVWLARGAVLQVRTLPAAR
ncbi:MAG TPA: metal ABC transporter permease [Candidatus Limnocylindrales bacterium]|nr:metal ABC transporter permease [Candidatus Limnocylindrales bacterium]